MASDYISRKTTLTENIISFCRYLRGHGFSVDPTVQADALYALTLIRINSRDELRIVLKSTLPKNQKQVVVFDKLFEAYWKALNQAVDAKIKEKPSGKKKQQPKWPPGSKPSFDTLKNWLYGNADNKQQETAFYSSQTNLSQKDFSSFTDDELWELRKLIKKIAKSIVNRKIRRFVTTHEHQKMDLRKIFRNNLKRGGEALDLYYKKHKETDLNLVILCDVSKSMELYSRFLIQFLYAFQHVYSRIETFVFSTSLYHVSAQLSNKNFERSLQSLTNEVSHWAGGTKIGKSLHTFVNDYAPHFLNRKTTVVIVSDGWDTGDVLLLKESMAHIYQSSGRVIWLNPLAGAPDFQPDTEGMKCSLPFIDILAPIHNIDSLKKLPGYLLNTRRKKRARVLSPHRTGMDQVIRN